MKSKRIHKDHKSNWRKIFVIYPNAPPFYYQLDEQGKLKVKLPRKPQRNIVNSYINLVKSNKTVNDQTYKKQTNNDPVVNDINTNDLIDTASLNIDLKPALSITLPVLNPTESPLLSTNLFDVNENKVDFSANNMKLLDLKSFDLNSFSIGPSFI